jgi:hypothetical protein
MNKIAYEADFYGWANEQAALLRDGRLNEADVANIAEEIESLARAEKREFVRLLSTLLTHLLTWKFLPGVRCGSSAASIKLGRLRLARLLEESPGLAIFTPTAMGRAFEEARLVAGAETRLDEGAMPLAPPWTFEKIMSPNLWPD